KLYGYMTVPNARNLMQSAKAGSVTTERESMISIASHIITHMENDVCYIIGPGTTTRVIMDTLNLKNTLLGVDVVLDRQLIGSDVNENGLLELLNQMENKGIQSKIIVTVIGGQGYVFGRGNQQISDRVIRRVGRENLIIVATEGKMIALNGKPLLVDTGNEDVNKMLSGYVKVITAMNREMAYRLTY
ncbi:MAG: ATP-NAD kinase, partial [Eubacteriales bacterium]|nr:ATP-NAD kinase [Eubacteriales bacterium]